MSKRSSDKKYYDLEKIKYEIVYELEDKSNKIFQKTIKGRYSKYWNGPNIVHASSFANQLAGKWDSYTCDCGTSLNGRFVKTVKVLEKEEYILEADYIVDSYFFGLCKNESTVYKVLTKEEWAILKPNYK